MGRTGHNSNFNIPKKTLIGLSDLIFISTNVDHNSISYVTNSKEMKIGIWLSNKKIQKETKFT